MQFHPAPAPFPLPWTEYGARKTARCERRATNRLTGTRHDWLRNPAAMEPADLRALAEHSRAG